MLSAGVDHQDLAKRGESLIRQSSNRYLTTVRIAFRAKQRRFDDFDGLLEESSVKPVQRAIDQYGRGNREHATRLWLILWLELWTRIVLEGSMDRASSLLEVLPSK